MVGSSPGPSVHFPDHDPVFERPAKRFRVTGKSSAVRRELVSGDGLPTPKRWKRLVPQGTGMLRSEDGLPPFLFPRTGLVDELVRHQGSVAAGKVSDAFSLLQHFVLPLNQLQVGTRLDRHAVS